MEGGAGLVRQFEFVQNVWINDRTFTSSETSTTQSSALKDGTLIQNSEASQIRKKITGLPAFTTLKGGAYFFLPGLKAPRYLAKLDEQAQPNDLGAFEPNSLRIGTGNL